MAERFVFYKILRSEPTLSDIPRGCWAWHTNKYGRWCWLLCANTPFYGIGSGGMWTDK